MLFGIGSRDLDIAVWVAGNVVERSNVLPTSSSQSKSSESIAYTLIIQGELGKEEEVGGVVTRRRHGDRL